MIVAVIDTNVLASGIAGFPWSQSPATRLLLAFLANRFTLIVSADILVELRRTLRKPYFARRISQADAEQAVRRLEQLAIYTLHTVEVHGVATHPEDDLVVAAALSASAEYLVTGDKGLQSRGAYQGVRILTPAQFAAFLAVP